jgi:hypothetical protein
MCIITSYIHWHQLPRHHKKQIPIDVGWWGFLSFQRYYFPESDLAEEFILMIIYKYLYISDL